MSVLSCVLPLLLASARADVPPANIEGCEGRAVGQSCQTDAGKSGACVNATCSRLDYSNGTPPSSVDYACVLCDASAKPTDDDGCSAVSAPSGLAVLGLLALVPLVGRRRSAAVG